MKVGLRKSHRELEGVRRTDGETQEVGEKNTQLEKKAGGLGMPAEEEGQLVLSLPR